MLSQPGDLVEILGQSAAAQESGYVFSGSPVGTAVFIDASGALFAGGIILALLFSDPPLILLTGGKALFAGIQRLGDIVDAPLELVLQPPGHPR